MRTMARLLTLIFALSIALLLAGGEILLVHAKAKPDGYNHDEIPLGMQVTKHLRPFAERPKVYDQDPRYHKPVKGVDYLAGTNKEIDAQNPRQLNPEETDSGAVVNLKWSFSLSHRNVYDGGSVREQIVSDLPPSKDISAAQVQLLKGAIREMHWHRVAEWGIVLNGSIIVSATNETGYNTTFQANKWDIWYFPKGVAHTLQGVENQNEFLLCFDDGNFHSVGTTFHIVDWFLHTPLNIIAKNFGVSEHEFDYRPKKFPYIKTADVKKSTLAAVKSESEYKFSLPMCNWSSNEAGKWLKVEKENFPILSSMASTVVKLLPGRMRELHWNTNGDEWLYFHSGMGRATVFVGGSSARTFDFLPGDTAVFPDNTAHYIENIGSDELVWVEIYKDNRVIDISLSQWLAATPPAIVRDLLNVSEDFLKYVHDKFQGKRVLV